MAGQEPQAENNQNNRNVESTSNEHLNDAPDVQNIPTPTPESAKPESSEDEERYAGSLTKGPGEPVKPARENKARRFLRQFLRWTLSILILLGIGAVLSLVLIYRPTARNLERTRNDLQSAQDELVELGGEIINLEAELANTEDELRALEDDYLEQQQELNRANMRVYLLSALADVHAARLALALENPDIASIQLASTSQSLENLAEAVPDAQKDSVRALQTRLELVFDELTDSPEAAETDLQVMADNLIQLENNLFIGP